MLNPHYTDDNAGSANVQTPNSSTPIRVLTFVPPAVYYMQLWSGASIMYRNPLKIEMNTFCILFSQKSTYLTCLMGSWGDTSSHQHLNPSRSRRRVPAFTRSHARKNRVPSPLPVPHLDTHVGGGKHIKKGKMDFQEAVVVRVGFSRLDLTGAGEKVHRERWMKGRIL